MVRGRPRSKNRIHLWNRKDSPYWYIRYVSDLTGKRKRDRTHYLKSEYSREQMIRIINSETGTQNVVEHSIDWLRDRVLYMLEIESKADKTIEGFKQAFRTLSEIYGGYSIHKIDRSAILQIKGYLKGKGNRVGEV